RYSVTTLEPGARLVLTNGLLRRPRSTAFLANSPAAIMTDGLDVFVQLVMAAITTEPWRSFLAARSLTSSCVGPVRSWTVGPGAGCCGLRSGAPSETSLATATVGTGSSGDTCP